MRLAGRHGLETCVGETVVADMYDQRLPSGLGFCGQREPFAVAGRIVVARCDPQMVVVARRGQTPRRVIFEDGSAADRRYGFRLGTLRPLNHPPKFRLLLQSIDRLVSRQLT